MKFVNKFKIVFSLALSFLLLTAASPPDDLVFEDFDKNDNGLISRSEFVKAFTYHYVDDWNTTDNAYLDDEDFYQVAYSIWDTDLDGKLSDEEWTVGYENYFDDYLVVNYEDIDVDADGYIVYKEYYDVIGDTDFFGYWDFDMDERLSQAELARGVFNFWDADNSGFIDLGEYTSFDVYYLDI